MRMADYAHPRLIGKEGAAPDWRHIHRHIARRIQLRWAAAMDRRVDGIGAFQSTLAPASRTAEGAHLPLARP